MVLPPLSSIWRRVLRGQLVRRWPPHPFDAQFGVETSKAPPFWQSRTGNELLDRESVGYGGSQPSVIRHAVRMIEGLDRATFIDVGCGKGRALVVATEFPFRRVVGIEMLRALCRTARKNGAILQRSDPGRPEIEVIQASATELKPSTFGDHIVLFLYNSFGREVFELFLRSLIDDMKANQRMKIFLILYNPVQADLVDSNPQFERLFAASCPVAAEDMPGSVFGNTEDSVVIFQNKTDPLQTQHPDADRPVIVTVPKLAATVRHAA